MRGLRVTGRIFLLSPASSSGARAAMLRRPEASFDLATRLRRPEGAPLGEVFSFLSGLYFRGKLAYALRFARPPAGVAGVHVITPSAGLMDPGASVTLRHLARWAEVDVDPDDPRYARPLRRDLRRLAQALEPACEVVLLGSIATPKYVEPLARVLGDRLRVPAEFAGRGDMSRGGLMLRSVREDSELTFVPPHALPRRTSRPPKLVPVPGILRDAAAPSRPIR